MSDETPNLPAHQRYRNLVLSCAEEAASSLPLSIPPADLQRAADRLLMAFRQAAMRSPDLMDCTPQSIAQAVVQSALTGLYPGGPMPDVYVFPRSQKAKTPNGDRWVKAVDWYISHHGYRKLAARAGVRIEAKAVMQGDEFSCQLGLRPDLHHCPHTSPSWDALTHVYVIAWDGTKPIGFEVLDRAQVVARRAKSDSARKGYGPWTDWPVEMALKTGIRYAVARGLVPLDESAAMAFQIEGEADVIKPEEAPARRSLALPDYSPLESLEASLEAAPEPVEVSRED